MRAAVSAALVPTPELPDAKVEACASGADASGTRRRRLWDLEDRAHCPVVGVCLPIAALRRLVNKVYGRPAGADDYGLHSSVVAECRRRNPLSEALHKHLDQRYQIVLRRVARLKTTDELAAWWLDAHAGHDLPGALWATLTHPRCTSTLASGVLGRVHMLQHQVGMATRVELERFESLIDENAVLARQLADAQGRSMRQAAAFTLRIDELDSELMRARAQHAASRTEIAQLKDLLATLEKAAPHLGERQALSQEAAQLREAVRVLQRTLSGAQEQLRRRSRAGAAEQRCASVPQLPSAPTAARPAAARSLGDCAVLCVGGRPASVPLYRLVIERTGGRFLHHDGGEEHNPAKLDATLAAADLVICQTGCVSHDAYWRVKDHCKRTGKRCFFVETPSRAALERALAVALDAPNLLREATQDAAALDPRGEA